MDLRLLKIIVLATGLTGCDWVDMIPGTESVTNTLDDKINEAKDLARLAKTATSLGKTLTPNQVRTALATPATKADVDASLKLLDDYRLTPEYLKFKTNADTVSGAAKSKGAGLNPEDGITTIKSGLKLADGHKSLLIAYQQLLDRNGGAPLVLPKLSRVGGLAAAARFVADASNAKDASSDKIAQKMIDDRLKIKSEVTTELKTAREKAAKTKDGILKDFDPNNFDISDVDWLKASQSMPIKTARHSGALALAFLAPQSLTLWKNMSVEERQSVLDLKTTSTKELPAILITVTHFSGENLVYLAGLGDLVKGKK